MIRHAGRLLGLLLLAGGGAGVVQADVVPEPPTLEVTRTLQTPFDPTWLEWTLFGLINLIIVAIYVVLWYRGTLRRPQNVFQEGGVGGDQK